MEYRNFELARHSTRSLNVELLKRVRNTYIVVTVDNTHAMLFVVVVVVVIQGLSYDECLRSDHVDNVHGIMLLLLLLLLLLLYRSYLIR